MKAAKLLVQCLENEDVQYIFGIPGEENIDMMDVLLDSDIRFITTRHEQGAAFMADVYAFRIDPIPKPPSTAIVACSRRPRRPSQSRTTPGFSST